MMNLSDEELLESVRDERIRQLHRELAAERLRADEGWCRYEAANRARNKLREERSQLMQRIHELEGKLTRSTFASDQPETHPPFEVRIRR
jgi:hypothetical protein